MLYLHEKIGYANLFVKLQPKKKQSFFLGCTDVAFFICNNGDYEMLDWVFENKLPIDADTCQVLAYNGHLDILKRIKEYGAKWDYATCDIAVEFGHVEIVRWAHNNGCEWTSCECYKKNKKNEVCKFTEKSIEKWLKNSYVNEFNFVKFK